MATKTECFWFEQRSKDLGDFFAFGSVTRYSWKLVVKKLCPLGPMGCRHPRSLLACRAKYIAWCLRRHIWENVDEVKLFCICLNLCADPTIERPWAIFWHGGMSDKYWLEQRPVNKVLVFEKCKLYEIYWRICDLYWEACFNQKILINGLNMGVSAKTLSRKDSHWLSSKEKVLDTTVGKEGHAESPLRYKRTHLNDFLWNRSNNKQWFFEPISEAKFTLSIEWLSYI